MGDSAQDPSRHFRTAKNLREVKPDQVQPRRALAKQHGKSKVLQLSALPNNRLSCHLAKMFGLLDCLMPARLVRVP